MKKTILIATLLLVGAIACAKPAYRITMQVDGSKDSILVMGYHYAEHLYTLDTARNNGRGKFVFEGDRELLPGLYFISNNNNHFFEFVVYHEKLNFTFTTKEEGWNRNMTVRGSKQNEAMLNYQRENDRLYDELKVAERSMDSAAFVEFRSRQYKRIDSVNMALVTNTPDAMIGKMLYATIDMREKVPLTHPDGTPTSNQERYEWFITHYFDHIPVDDDFIVRTPKNVFYQHAIDYVEKYLHGLPPERIIPLLDTLIDRSEVAPEVFHWLVHHLTEYYLQSPIMVYDEVYVHLVQRYFATGKVFWVPPTYIDEEVERANKWERLLVGREAPELILYDTLHRAVSLHHMPSAYTLLVFWSPTCGHCREIIPELYTAFLEYKDRIDLAAYTILSEFDNETTVKWKKFMHDHKMNDPRWLALNGGEANIDWHDVYDITSTPQIYLIDNSTHKFLAKKMNADLFRQICNTLIK